MLAACRVGHEHVLGDLQRQRLGGHGERLQQHLHLLGQGDVLEVGDAEVDRHRQVVAGGPPLLQVTQRALQHPQGEPPHESGLLGEGEEDVRVEQSPVGVLPANQRLEAGHRAGPEVELGLVVVDQLVGVQCRPELLERLEPVTRVGGAVRCPDLEAMAAALGGVHRRVGAGQQQ
jgi:hypothetical protein